MTFCINRTRQWVSVFLLLAAAAPLGGCETTGDPAAKPVAEPMTRTRAARDCWMETEKGRGDLSLDKRADVVNKCIEQKMKEAPPAAPPA
jgi:hypothetical protein